MFYYNSVPFATPSDRVNGRVNPETNNIDTTPRMSGDPIDFVNLGDKLIRKIPMVRGVPESEVPAWMKDKPVVEFYSEIIECIVVKDDGSLTIHDDFNPEQPSHCAMNSDQKIAVTHTGLCEIMNFALGQLFKQNKYLYALFHDPSISTFKGLYELNLYTVGILDLLINPKKQSQIESLAKTISPLFALESVKNNIDCVNSKKALVLPFDMLHRCKTMQLERSISLFQELVQNGVMSLEQLDKFLLGVQYLAKFKICTATELRDVFASDQFQKMIRERKINLEWLMQMILKNAFMLCRFESMSSYYNYNRSANDRSAYTPRIKILINHYLDAISALPEGKYPTSNIEVFHIISTRNKKIFEKRRPEEFAAVAERLRKLKWKSGSYEFAPMQTEDELFYVGERYNNCLPIYRDKIIDDNAIVMCVYRETSTGLENCPDVVFEVTPHLDILQIKTFNDADVTDRDMLDLISAWKDAKRYLLTKGRTVYRDPDEDEAGKPSEEVGKPTDNSTVSVMPQVPQSNPQPTTITNVAPVAAGASGVGANATATTPIVASVAFAQNNSPIAVPSTTETKTGQLSFAI